MTGNMKNRILYVDDDLIIRVVLEKLFSAEFDVVTASSGEEGLQYLRTDGPLGSADHHDALLSGKARRAEGNSAVVR